LASYDHAKRPRFLDIFRCYDFKILAEATRWHTPCFLRGSGKEKGFNYMQFSQVASDECFSLASPLGRERDPAAAGMPVPAAVFFFG
jgi:hypothetical protein